MTAVVLAASGSHILHLERGSDSYLLFTNAVIYQLLHAVLVLGLCAQKDSSFWLKSALVCTLLGISLFSGGLYILIIYGKSWITWIIPVGGSLLILGWLNLTILGFKRIQNND